MAFRTKKISQMDPKGSNLASTDLLEISELVSGSYVTKSITGAEIIASVPPTTVDWGDIGGTLSTQTDLQNALNAKQATVTLTTTGTSGASTFVANTLNVPTYSLAGLGGVPTTRTLTINGTTQDLSADRTFTVSTGITIGTTAITSGTVGRVLFQGTGNVVQQSSSLSFDDTAKAFTLSGNQNASTGITISNTTSGTSATGTLIFQSNGTNQSIIQKFSTLSTAYKILGANDFVLYNSFFGGDISILNDNPGGRIKLTAGAGSTSNFTIASTGNVLINTTTDAGFKLDVNGTARISSNATFGTIAQNSGMFWDNTNNSLGLGVGTPLAKIHVKRANSSVLIDELSANSTAGAVFFTTTKTVNTFAIAGEPTNTYVNAPTAGGYINFNQALVERMRLAGTTGNFLINTTTDAGFKLDVNGTARVKGTGTTSATTSFTVENSTASTTFRVLGSGTTLVKGPEQRISFNLNDNVYIGHTAVNNVIGANQSNRLFFGSEGDLPIFTLGTGTVIIGTLANPASSASAKFRIDSTTQGFLPPRMTTTEINAIASPAEGLQIYNTTISHMCVYQAGSWVKINHSPM